MQDYITAPTRGNVLEELARARRKLDVCAVFVAAPAPKHEEKKRAAGEFKKSERTPAEREANVRAHQERQVRVIRWTTRKRWLTPETLNIVELSAEEARLK